MFIATKLLGSQYKFRINLKYGSANYWCTTLVHAPKGTTRIKTDFATDWNEFLLQNALGRDYFRHTSQFSKRFISKTKQAGKTKFFPVTSVTDVENMLKETALKDSNSLKFRILITSCEMIYTVDLSHIPGTFYEVKMSVEMFVELYACTHSNLSFYHQMRSSVEL